MPAGDAESDADSDHDNDLANDLANDHSYQWDKIQAMRLQKIFFTETKQTKQTI